MVVAQSTVVMMVVVVVAQSRVLMVVEAQYRGLMAVAQCRQGCGGGVGGEVAQSRVVGVAHFKVVVDQSRVVMWWGLSLG